MQNLGSLASIIAEICNLKQTDGHGSIDKLSTIHIKKIILKSGMMAVNGLLPIIH